MTQSLIVVSAFVLSIGTLITPSVHAQALAENAPASKQLLQSDLKGVSGQEAMVFFVEFAPGQGLPWHVHPGGHELVYRDRLFQAQAHKEPSPGPNNDIGRNDQDHQRPPSATVS